jgi:hypothetical protein
LSSTVHSIEAIEALLRRGTTPKTDNRAALVALGFVRATPVGEEAREETLWERSVDHTQRTASGHKILVRERAVLEKSGLALDEAGASR